MSGPETLPDHDAPRIDATQGPPSRRMRQTMSTTSGQPSTADRKGTMGGAEATRSSSAFDSALDTFLPGGSHAWSQWRNGTETSVSAAAVASGSRSGTRAAPPVSESAAVPPRAHSRVDGHTDQCASTRPQKREHPMTSSRHDVPPPQAPPPHPTCAGDDAHEEWLKQEELAFRRDYSDAIRIITFFILLMVALALLFGMVCLRYHADAERTKQLFASRSNDSSLSSSASSFSTGGAGVSGSFR